MKLLLVCPGVVITISRSCLFLYRLYRRKDIPNKNTNVTEPIVEPAMTDADVDVDDGDAGVDDGEGDVVGIDGGVDVDVDVDGGVNSKILVHLNSLLLLISSNKISLSVA